jgi:serine/threonine protein kinase
LPTLRRYLVQECCSAPLSRALEEGLLHDKGSGQVHAALVLTLLLDCARGLAYLHSKSIIHGDIKPDNVMLKAEFSRSASAIAKLTDFGLSVALDPAATHASNLKAGEWRAAMPV